MAYFSDLIHCDIWIQALYCEKKTYIFVACDLFFREHAVGVADLPQTLEKYL